MGVSSNDIVRIKPTPAGWRQIVTYVDAFNDDFRQRPHVTFRMSVPVPDSDGYVIDQFWRLMTYFDWTGGIGSEVLFCDLQLDLAEAGTKETV